MSRPWIEVNVGGAPTADEAAAILAAAASLLEDEARALLARDPRPQSYRSAWRAAAIREGLRQPVSVTRG